MNTIFLGIVQIENEPFEYPKGIREYYLWMFVNEKGTYIIRDMYNTDYHPSTPEFLFQSGGEDYPFTDYKDLLNEYLNLYIKTDINHGSYIHPVIESRSNVKVKMKYQKQWVQNETTKDS